MAPGSVSTRFPVSARKQTTPIDGAIQIKPARCSRIEKNMPLDQISALYVDHGSDGTRFCVSATKQTTPIDGASQN